MARAGALVVEEPPKHPEFVFDGDCGFCRLWVERWRGITGDRVVYRTYQEAAERYPQIGVEQFQQKAWLIEPDGQVWSGAGAVLRLYTLVGEKRLCFWLYETVAFVRAISELVYAFVVRHRTAGAVATRWLWGASAERPRYRRMRDIFLRALGVTYLLAFWSLGVQVDGLIGSRGILPVGDFLGRLELALGSQAHWQFPTLLWLDPSDRFLHFLCWAGVAVSALLVVGLLPVLCLVVLWLFYLSLTVAGQEFLGFQWDALLLETGLLAVLFAPCSVWLGRARSEPSRGVVWLIRWLLFRVLFLSGVVKLASGDPAWSSFQALRYHYETQPLPTWTSWYIHQMPLWFQRISVGMMFWGELVAPCLVFAPRRPRMLGFGSLVLLQVLIAATGNYGFFNVLTLVLCLVLVEDRDWSRKNAVAPAVQPGGRSRGLVIGFVGFFLVVVTTMQAIDRVRLQVVFPWPMEQWREWVEPLRSTNAYGLFEVMTTQRPEIVVEGSDDGVVWKPYLFRWKPGELDRRPLFTTPHMPRLDWQMWFAALAHNCMNQPWFLKFEQTLLEGSPAVLALLRENPFPDKPPRSIRARLYLYHFTTWGSDAWWNREELGFYCPPIELKRGEATVHGSASRGGQHAMAGDVDKSEHEWRAQLTAEQYHIMREKGTEPAFTGKYWNTKTPGIYRCAGCGQELFASETKFDSGTGWPSYYKPVDPERVEEHTDRSFGMIRTEVTCSRCGAHLGHLFEDGPAPTGMRYCINSAALELDTNK